MENKRVIFVSAVTDEFHKTDPLNPLAFQSYRDTLKQAFRILAPHYEVIVQEDLPIGDGDLLETLDNEIKRSMLVIHLIGDLAGSKPPQRCVRRLYERYNNFLEQEPELKNAISQSTNITYTQWEIYIAFHYDLQKFIYEARSGAPRSPGLNASSEEYSIQYAHRKRVESMGVHYGQFADQGDLTRNVIRSFLHFRIDPDLDKVEADEESEAKAWENQRKIVHQIAAQIKKPNPRDVPVRDLANTVSFIVAVRNAAKQWNVNLSTIVDILARYEEDIRHIAENRPAPKAFYDQAFAFLALGDYTSAKETAQYSADLAINLLNAKSTKCEALIENAVNAFLLVHEACIAMGDRVAAKEALEKAGTLVDIKTKPLLWAEVHELLIEFLLKQAQYDRADKIVDEIIDIREDLQGENHPDLAKVLLYWASILIAKGNYLGAESVCKRAEGIFKSQTPPHIEEMIMALSISVTALEGCGQFVDAESLCKQVLEISEKTFGQNHPGVAMNLLTLGRLLIKTERYSDAVSFLKRALNIAEEFVDSQQELLLAILTTLSSVHFFNDQLSLAEKLLNRAMAISENNYGYESHFVATCLIGIAQLKSNIEAESFLVRAIKIRKNIFGNNHELVAEAYYNLATVYFEMERWSDAELFYKRAAKIIEMSQFSTNPIMDELISELEVCRRKQLET